MSNRLSQFLVVGFCLSNLLCLAQEQAIASAGFKSLFTFGNTDGNGPAGSLVQGTDGNLYGVTESGGTGIVPVGVLYRISLKGETTILHNFCSSPNCVDGNQPNGLALGIDGSLYGTTYFGGEKGQGLFYRASPSGAITPLYSFCSQANCADGSHPSPPVLGRDGNFYGITYTDFCSASGCGTAYKITPQGVYTKLHTFSASDGRRGSGPLAESWDGSLYGTQSMGGAFGRGTIYKLTPKGLLTVLYNFCSQPNCSDGASPTGPLAQGNDGNFYGVALGGTGGGGVIFSISPVGVYSKLHDICADPDCPAFASGALLQGTDGAFYGSSSGGSLVGCGASPCGTVFKMSPTGQVTVLHYFTGADGSSPIGPVTQATTGLFYGTTSNLLYCCGTIYAMNVGLGPFVKTLPAAGQAGQTIQILGTNLAAASAVTFGGVPATFQIVSGTLIDATVPYGAKTGAVTVTTPSGTLKANTRFVIRP